MPKFYITFDQLLDMFFHLPTLLIVAALTMVMVWQVYGVGLNLGDSFVRVSSYQGNLTLSWREGCCELDW